MDIWAHEWNIMKPVSFTSHLIGKQSCVHFILSVNLTLLWKPIHIDICHCSVAKYEKA